MKKLALAAVLLIALAVAGSSVANASQLNINGPRNIAQQSDQACTTATIGVTGVGHVSGNMYSQVQFSNIPEACAGEELTYVLFRANGSVVSTGTTPAQTGTATATASSNYDYTQVLGARVLIDTWPVPAAWTAPTPPTPPPPSGPFYCEELTPYPGNAWEAPPTYGTPTGNLCTVTVVTSTFWGNNQHFNLTYHVSGAANWRVTVDFTDPFFNGLVPSRLSSDGNPLRSPTYSCTQLPTFVGQTNLNWNPNVWHRGYLAGSSAGTGGSLCG